MSNVIQLKDHRKRQRDPDQINSGSVIVEVMVDLVTVWGGGATVSLTNDDEIARYEADPDEFAANYFGCTKDEYREWIGTMGTPLCREKTKSGGLCKNPAGRSQLALAEWKRRHRKIACSCHGGGKLVAK